MAERGDRTLRQRFLDGMSQAAATVNVVTTDGPAGRYGVTVSAMSSVSANSDPPTMLVCVNRRSSAAAPIRANGVFRVDLVRDSPAHLSDIFAGRTRLAKEEKFPAAEWATETTGAPRIANPLVAFDCRLLIAQEIGTHYVFVGAVQSVFLGEPGECNSSMRTEAMEAQRYSRPSHQPKVHRVLYASGLSTRWARSSSLGVLEHLPRDSRLALQLVDGDQRAILDHLRRDTVDMALIYDWEVEPSIVKERLIGLRPYALFFCCRSPRKT